RGAGTRPLSPGSASSRSCAPAAGRLPAGRSPARAAPDALRPSASRQTSGRLRRSGRTRGPEGRLAAYVKFGKGGRAGERRGTSDSIVLGDWWLVAGGWKGAGQRRRLPAPATRLISD